MTEWQPSIGWFSGIKIARSRFERITDAQAAMANIDVVKRCKVTAEKITRQIFDGKFSKICCKTYFP